MNESSDYEFYNDWSNRDGDEYDISLEDYNEMRCIEEYGDDFSFDDDDDSNDPY